MGGYVILSRLATGAGTLRARPYFWDVVVSLIVIGASGALWLYAPTELL